MSWLYPRRLEENPKQRNSFPNFRNLGFGGQISPMGLALLKNLTIPMLARYRAISIRMDTCVQHLSQSSEKRVRVGS